MKIHDGWQKYDKPLTHEEVQSRVLKFIHQIERAHKEAGKSKLVFG